MSAVVALSGWRLEALLGGDEPEDLARRWRLARLLFRPVGGDRPRPPPGAQAVLYRPERLSTGEAVASGWAYVTAPAYEGGQHADAGPGRSTG